MSEPNVKGYWSLAIGICLGVFCIVALVSWAGDVHWASNLWFGYTWSSLKGNGPEALVQTIVYGAIAIIFVPVVRRFIAHEFGKIHESIHVHSVEAQAHLHHIAEWMELPKFEHSDQYKDHVAKYEDPK